MSSNADVLIVGAGFSGTVLAANLAVLRPDIRILLVEKSAEGKFGMAFQTTCPAHVLNVPASGMSAFVDKPTDFIEWACSNGVFLKPQSFAPRMVYGRYLAHILERLETQRNVTVVRDEAVGLDKVGEGWICRLRSGATLTARDAVLAFGNFPPARRSQFDSVKAHASYVANPWGPVSSDAIRSAGMIGIVGSGLTAVDVVLALENGGFDGCYTLISRHGLLPLPHKVVETPMPAELVPKPNASLRKLVREIRRCAKLATEMGSDWRAVFDVIRPNVSVYWRTLHEADRRQFLRHLRSYWDVHRHRVAPDVWAQIERLVGEGRLKTIAGTLLPVRAEGSVIEVAIRSTDGSHSTGFRFDLLFNCTGSPTRVAEIPSELLQDLVSSGAAALDATGMGLACDEAGNVLDAHGNPQPGLYVLGVLRRGQLWESTAIPDLRKYAATLAEHIVELID